MRNAGAPGLVVNCWAVGYRLWDRPDLAALPALGPAGGDPRLNSTSMEARTMSATATQAGPAPFTSAAITPPRRGARVLVGRRIEAEVYLYDYPADGDGRRYFVEKGFASKADLAALIADYRRRAERLGACLMSREGADRAFELASLA